MTKALMDAGRIYLVGYRGAGKSTVGPLLAERLGWGFVDTDDEIIKATGRSIADLFVDPGEAGFRVFETDVLTKCSAMLNHVVATGGGTVLRCENRTIFADTGIVVWLRAPAEVLFQRIQADAGSPLRRPHLVAGGSLEEVKTLLQVREPHYQSVAKIIIDTAGRSPDEVVSAILASC
jgi:shikimate kinase